MSGGTRRCDGTSLLHVDWRRPYTKVPPADEAAGGCAQHGGRGCHLQNKQINKGGSGGWKMCGVNGGGAAWSAAGGGGGIM